ncbi:hypothetical protein FPQ18DRAFT_123154 [Pyronema domesticum]|nr:hypothetical protein FPQ18DRAFT_123154 [Pyronema domesticum]
MKRSLQDYDHAANAPEVVPNDPPEVVGPHHLQNQPAPYVYYAAEPEEKITATPQYPIPVDSEAAPSTSYSVDPALAQPSKEPPKKRICGLRRRTFVITCGIVLVIIMAGVIGGIIAGVTRSGGGNDDSGAVSSGSNESPRPSPTTVQFGNFEPSEDGNGNPTMLEGSYLAATSGGNDTRYLTEARVFYQDVRGTIRTIYCKELNVCALDLNSFKFRGAKKGTPLVATGNFEEARRIKVFYVDTDNKLQGKILRNDGEMDDDDDIDDAEYPRLHSNSKLAAVWYPENGHIRLFYQRVDGRIQTLSYNRGRGWETQDILETAYPGSSLAAVTWGENIRLFYVGTDGFFSQYQWSPESGWNIDGASSAEINNLTLSQNNPILPVISSIGQNGNPNIEILTTDYPGEIVGAWAGNTDATLTYTPGSPVEVYQEGYPMSLIYLGLGDKGTKYKVLYHGLDRQLYEMDYDGTRWVELEFRVKF